MRFVQLIFSPTGGVKRAAGLLSAPMAEQPDIIDLSLPLNGTPRFSPEDVCLIAVPCFGGRVPEIALERLAQTQGGGARAILIVKIRLFIKRVYFLHHLIQARIAHDHRINDRIFVILKLILLEHRHTALFRNGNFAGGRFKLPGENF